MDGFLLLAEKNDRVISRFHPNHRNLSILLTFGDFSDLQPEIQNLMAFLVRRNRTAERLNLGDDVDFDQNNNYSIVEKIEFADYNNTDTFLGSYIPTLHHGLG